MPKPVSILSLVTIVVIVRPGRVLWDKSCHRSFFDNTKSWSGDHCVDPRLVPGVIYSTHPVISKDPGIMDLAPTILTLFGVEVPGHMNGNVLEVDTPAPSVSRAAA